MLFGSSGLSYWLCGVAPSPPVGGSACGWIGAACLGKGVGDRVEHRGPIELEPAVGHRLQFGQCRNQGRMGGQDPTTQARADAGVLATAIKALSDCAQACTACADTEEAAGSNPVAPTSTNAAQSARAPSDHEPMVLVACWGRRGP